MAKNMIGSWAFLAGVVLAVVAGILAGMEIIDLNSALLASVLMALGAIVGLLNVTRKETSSFLLAGVSIIIASVFGAGVAMAVPGVGSILGALLFIVVPATVIVGIKSAFELAKR